MLGLTLAVSTAALVVAEHIQQNWLRTLSKCVAVASFLAAALSADLHVGPAAGQAVMAALVLSAVGDILLLGRSEKSLLAGLAAFLLAHLGYLGAFWLLGISLTGLLVASLPVAVFGLWVHRWLAPHTGDLARPVLAYIVVICAMVAAAAGVAWQRPDLGGQLLFGAAIVFLLSDLCVAYDRFIAPGPWVRTVGLPLYFGAQWLFVLAASTAITS